MKSNELLYMYRQKQMEFISLYNYNNEYNIFNSKVDMNSTVWRFMDLSKLLALLNSNSLFLSNPKSFKDPFEGAFSESDLIKVLGEPPSYIPDLLEDYNSHRKRYIETYRAILDFVGVSCWHLNEYESAAMWDLYLNSNEGIAIKTSIQSLYDSLIIENANVYIGKVQYIDYFTDMASKNVLETLFYKRKSFSHEQELRLLVLDDDEKPYFYQEGANINVDLNNLIEEIYIHPTAPTWFVKSVEGLLKKYAVDKPIIQSSLYSGPRVLW